MGDFQSTRLEPGVRIGGRYRVGRLSAEGGMAAVYQARDLWRGETVALKVAPASHPSGRRLLREAALLSDVQHPHVVSYRDSGRVGKLAYLAMEWAKGTTLQRVLRRRRRLGLDESLEVARSVASALAAVHATGVVHSDVKPCNVMVEADLREIRLLDFGIAKLIGMTDDVPDGMLLGTPAYMSPEQACGRAVDERSDVWSLGVLLFRCLVGHLPFRGPSGHAVLLKVALNEPPDIGKLIPDVPRDVRAVLGRMLVRDLGRRCPDGAAATTEIDRLLSAYGRRTTESGVFKTPCPDEELETFETFEVARRIGA
jgi:serine/threonine protein kinase